MTERFYRDWVKGKDLVLFKVKQAESDLLISAESNLSKEAEESLELYRSQLRKYISKHPDFKSSLKPITVKDDTPDIIKVMAESAAKAKVGPMAAVAGVIAEFIGKDLLKFSSQVIVENGGDIFMKSKAKRNIAIFAGDSELTGKLNIEINTKDTPIGICTSSGTVGHSLSFGRTNATIVISESTALADAVATACGNLVRQEEDMQNSLSFAKDIKGVLGILIIVGEKIGICGNLKMAEKGQFTFFGGNR